MENSKSKIIKEIAENLNCGFNSYYNSKTNEIVTIPNFSQIMNEEEFQEAFKADLEKVARNKFDYIKIEVLENFESFKIMERFVEQIPDKQFKTTLLNVLQNKKPFQKFKHLIESSDYRKSWFDFKQNELEEIVEKELKRKKDWIPPKD